MNVKRYDAASWVFACGLFMVVSFVWMYREPVNADFPMHLAAGKAFIDLLCGHVAQGYPYQLDIKLSSYALPEILLSGLIKLFGINIAAKFALSMYAAAVPLLMYVLVAKIDQKSRWARLVGLPFSLNYFFHWGFWPFMVGQLAVLLALVLSLELRNRRFELLVNASTRFLVLLCHPTAILALGVIDLSLELYRILSRRERHIIYWFKIGCRMLITWLPALALAIYIFKARVISIGKAGVDTNNFEWSNMGHQLVQLVRPLYLTQYWWEEVIPLAMFGILTWEVLIRSKKGGIARSYLFAGFVVMLIGSLMPRESFLGSWENGARLVLMGYLLIASSWASIECCKRGLLIAWIVTALCFNIAASHYIWWKIEPSVVWALVTLKSEFTGYYLETRGIFSQNRPSIGLGDNVGSLAWAYGDIEDTNNCGVFGTGPVKYIGDYGHDFHEEQHDRRKAIIFNHPYSPMLTVPVIAET